VADDRRGDPAGASAPGRELLSAADVTRTIARIAHQIIEKTAGDENVVLIGIPTRGAVLARRLAAAIEEFAGCIATTCAGAPPARSRTPWCPRAGSTTHWSCSSTTC
jgi:Phosphoribosyl transferase domain